MPACNDGEIWRNKRGAVGKLYLRSDPDDEMIRRLLHPTDRVTTVDRYPFAWVPLDGGPAYTVTADGRYDMVAGSPCPHDTENDLTERVYATGRVGGYVPPGKPILVGEVGP